MEKAKLFFGFMISFLLGIFVAGQIQSGHFLKGGFVFVWVLFLFGDFIFNGRNVLKVALLLVSFAFGMLRFHFVSVSEIMPYGSENFLFGSMFDLRQQLEGELYKIFPEPHASFMAGLLLGVRKGIPDYLMDDFNRTGLTHIIAISGYNITLLIVVVSGIFGFLNRKKRVIFSLIFIFLFVILVGASASVVRAAIMGGISLMALFFGRRYFVGLSLLAAAFFMNLWNPRILLYDVGFQLSFLATCGLVYLSPTLEQRFNFLPSILAIRESFILTISAQIFALPIIIYNFGALSLIAPIANIFVLPLIPLAMIFGFLSLTLSTVVFGFSAYLILTLIIFLVKIFASFEFLYIEIEWFSWWIVTLYYFFLLHWLRNKKIDFI